MGTIYIELNAAPPGADKLSKGKTMKTLILILTAMILSACASTQKAQPDPDEQQEAKRIKIFERVSHYDRYQ